MKNIARYPAILLLLFLISFSVSAQSESSVTTERLKFQMLTIDDGLSQGLITEIVQDIHGFLWFGTKDGLNKYDGYGFKIYRPVANDSTSLAGNHIITMLNDVRGLLWIFFSNGKIDVFNPETEIAFHLNPVQVNLKTWQQFRFMQKTDGTVFYSDASSYVKIETDADAASRFGYRFKIHDLTSRLPKGNKTVWVSSFISSKNELYFSLNDSVFVYSDADLSRPVEVKKYHYTKFSSAETPAVVMKEDSVRHRLMSMGEYCFTLYDLRTGMKTDSVALGLENYFREYYFDYKGRIWLSSAEELFLYDPETKILKRLLAQDTKVKDIMLESVTSVFTDRSGVTWLGSGGYGLIKYNPAVERFHHVGGAGNNPISIHGIWEDNDHQRIWFSRNNDVIFFYDRKNSDITEPLIREKDAGSGPVAKKFFGRAFCVDKNGYWVQNESRICYLDRELKIQKKIIPQKINATIEGMSVRDSRGNVWIASGILKGFILHKLNENSDMELASYWFPVQESYSLYPFTSALVTDAHDNLWIGTVEGLFFFNTEKESWVHYVHKENDSTSLPVSSVFSLYNDAHSENILWVGTDGGGLTRFDKNTGRSITYTTNAGLPNNVIYGILPDDSGNLWLSTNNGIARFNPHTKAVKIFSVKDGLQSNEFNRYASRKLASGELVFGGVNGFNIFNPAEINENSFQPDILFTTFKIGNKEVPLNTEGLKKNIFAAREINLNYTQNFITFGFASTDFSAPDNIMYQYQLEGLDDEWLPATRLNEATYTNLNPGTYTFKVRGTNSDGAWSKNEASINIFISPPWWGTWWFRTFVILLVAAAIYSFYRYRLAQAVKLMSLRNRIASDLHDEIGSTLSSISFYGEATKKMLQGNEKAGNVLTKINSNTSEMMEAMSDIVWAINTRNDKLDNLVNRMRAFAVQVSEAKEFKLHLAENKDLPDMPLDMYERKNIYLIFKEAINNAAKYSVCKNVWIEFSKKSRLLEMKITDDGKGFTVGDVSMLSKKGGGNGLVNMKKRADDLKGELKIISEEGKGTEVLLKMRLKS